jgi:hypothetical protein
MKIFGYSIQKKQGMVKKVGSFEIIPSSPFRAAQDINDWLEAVKGAESVMMPSRRQLYEIYNQTVLDDDYVTASDKRKANILNLELVYKKDNEPDEKVNEWLATPLFRQFKNDLMDTIFWGHSLFQFDYSKDEFFYVLIPRENVNPERKTVLRSPYDMTGIPYTTDEYWPLLQEVTYMERFGLLRIISIYAIYKRNMLGDWANYSELAGNNFRQVNYTGSDTNIRSSVVKALNDAGSGGVVALPEGVTVDYINQSSQSANALFEGFHKRMSDSILRLILGQTITTTDATAAYARAVVAKEVESDINTNDRVFILSILNTQFKQVMQQYGLPTDGEFMFEEVEKTPMKELLENDKFLAEILEIGTIPVEYLEEKYGIILQKEESLFIEGGSLIEISNPYPNEHAARLIQPDKFDRFRRTKGGTVQGKKVPKTISVIWGHLKDSDEWAAQALRFPKKSWTAAQAKKWLKDNGIKYISFEPAA